METSHAESQLKLREYGRNVQEMVEYAKTLEDRETRNRLVQDIIRIMGNINPHLRDIPDYNQKLWDHLHYLADFELDVDAPYPKPEKSHILQQPEKRLQYFDLHPQFRMYGTNVELLVEKAVEEKDEDRKMALVTMIANIMHQHLKNADRDSNAELTILEHLKSLSKGELVYEPNQIRFYKPRQQQQQHQQQRSYRDQRKGRGGYRGKRSRK